MPANAKYLTASRWQRFGKISAAILGGYLAAMSFHLALAAWFNHVNILITSTFSGFVLWTVLMIIAFLSPSSWRIWLLYLLLTIAFTGIAYLGKRHNPGFLQRDTEDSKTSRTESVKESRKEMNLAVTSILVVQ